MRVDIPSFRLDQFKDRASRLETKAEQLNDLDFSFDVHNDDSYVEAKTVQMQEGKATVTVEYVPIELQGDIDEAVGLNDWELIAAIDFEPQGNVIRSHEEGLAEDWGDTSPKRCDHCGHDRLRKNVYIVRHQESGEERQVGSTCLVDHLGHGSAEELASTYASLQGLRDEITQDMAPDTFWDECGGDHPFVSLRALLEIVDRVMQRDGWVSSSDAYQSRQTSTKETALRTYRNDRLRTRLYDDYPETEHDLDAVIEWAQSLEDPDSDYLHNLRVIAQSDQIHDKHVGLAASMIVAYENAEKQKWIDNHTKDSQWVGDVGERIEDKTVKLVTVRNWGKSRYGRGTETKWMYKFVDTSGNVLIWVSTSAAVFPIKDGDILDPDSDSTDDAPRKFLTELEGHTFKGVRFTVKDHDTYDGTKQTFVKRMYFPQRVS